MEKNSLLVNKIVKKNNIEIILKIDNNSSINLNIYSMNMTLRLYDYDRNTYMIDEYLEFFHRYHLLINKIYISH